MAESDALGLFQSLRPTPPTANSDIRPARSGVPGSPDLHSLAMVPGTPAYNERIPKPPCYTCGEDHLPGHAYSHPWSAEPIHDEPVSASAIMRRPAPAVFDARDVASPQETLRRVVLYVGRGDTYVVAVEEAPEWDAVHTFKVEPDMVLPLISMARALGTKISDKTGGDLLMLEQEYGHGRSQPEAHHDRGAARPGSDLARRPEPGPDWAEESQPGEDPPAPG